MSTLFSLLLLASGAAFLVRLVKPQLIKEGNRKKSSLFYDSVAIVFAIATWATAPEGVTQQAEPTEQTQQTNASFDRQKLTNYLNTLNQEQKFMGSVAIDSAGTEVYNRSFGLINKQGDIVKADTQTKYHIGSITKTFTATMIMQLVEEGKLSLSTKLADYYSDIPQADSITIEHLLRHQSGLYNFTKAHDYIEWKTEQRSKEQMLEEFRNYSPQFTPGSKTRYSNTNYVLLSYIIEDITGTSYAKQLKKRITAPLELQHTYYGDGIDPAENEAASFRYRDEQWNAMPETDMSIPSGAGAIVSTPDDLTDFIYALFEGKLVSEQSLEKMTSFENRMGIGLIKSPFYNTFTYGHSGTIDGFRSHLAYFPDQKVAMAITANGMNYKMNDILIGIPSIYFGKDFEIPNFDTQSSN